MPKVSQEHLDARRQQILDAASVCFSSKGFHRTTMQDIVTESELSAGAIYRYFTSKDQIIQAIADDRHVAEWQSIRGALDPDAAAKTFHQLSRMFFEPLADPAEKRRRRIGIEMWAEALHSPSILETTREGVNEPLRLFTKVIAKAQEQGDMGSHVDPEALGRVMIALFQGFVLQQAWDDVPVEPFLVAIDSLLDLMTTRIA
jgi:AcrR family transcriptional regulator